jgi:hypothetical protein
MGAGVEIDGKISMNFSDKCFHFRFSKNWSFALCRASNKRFEDRVMQARTKVADYSLLTFFFSQACRSGWRAVSALGNTQQNGVKAMVQGVWSRPARSSQNSS